MKRQDEYIMLLSWRQTIQAMIACCVLRAYYIVYWKTVQFTVHWVFNLLLVWESPAAGFWCLASPWEGQQEVAPGVSLGLGRQYCQALEEGERGSGH